MHNANNIKIWSIATTRRIARILHLLTGIDQYVYKQGLSTLDSIQKIEQYIRENNKNAQILLTDIAKAFDTINRTKLWATLYKKDHP